MATKASIQKNLRIRKTVEKYKKKRDELLKIIRNRNISIEERLKAQNLLFRFPRDSSPTRIRNICAQTGKARAHYRYFGMSRFTLRHFARKGMLAGVCKIGF